MPSPATTASAKTTFPHYPGVLGLEIANYNSANSGPRPAKQGIGTRLAPVV